MIIAIGTPLASDIAHFLDFHFNQGNRYADKIRKFSQDFQRKYQQRSLLSIFLDVTLFLNMVPPPSH